ncbi:MAG TPA: hypothetical protein PK228_12805 [Saprospiraceae bacterium]|nr:hypothetical protein [Saprospiraceae bacterium]
MKVSSSSSDSFISKLLGDSDLEGKFDLGLEWSPTSGLKIKGSGNLEVSIPIHINTGILEIDTIHLSLDIQDDGTLSSRALSDFRGKLGPLSLLVEHIGAKIDVNFPSSANAEYGIFDLKSSFTPPSGIALSINAQKFSGGGYLYIGENRYAGVINLNFQGVINFTAIAIINTKLPGGREGYALLLVITADGFKPIQLGLGFTLNGIGGLLALHRTMDLEVLRAGIRDGISDRLLFPEKPLENIDLILSDLESVFPIEEGRFVFGPMFIIGWGGVKTLLEIKIGLLIEVPNPVKVAITGVLRTILPTEGDGAEVVIINVSFLGTFEPEKKMIAFDASLFNSRILNFTLEGDMAFRLLYGDKPNFLLSVGGFHPAFQPPPMALGSLQRLTLSLLDEEKAKVQLEMYFAVTSNTVQVGAHMAAVFQAMGYEVVGHLGFDALFQFNPFYFKVDIQIGFALMKNGKEKAAINVALHVEGPTPWKVSGYAEMKILGIEFQLNFDKTFGEERHTILPNVDLWPLLREELMNDANWTVLLPVGGQELVQIRVPEPPPNAAPGSLVISPAGSIQVSQRLIPLKTVLQQYGNQGIDGSNRFEITRFTLNGVDIGTLADSYETFAPAQYQRLSDAEKLSGSSFISAISGVKTAESYASKNGPAVMRDISYDVILIDGPDRYYLLNSYLANANKQQADFNTGDDVGLKTVKNGQAESLNTGVKTNLPNDRYRYVIGADRLETHRKNGATGQSQWAKVNQAKQLVTDRKIPVLEERYRIVHTGTLDPYIDTGIYLESDARNVLAGILVAHPALHDDLRIVPEYAVSEIAYIDESLNLANA